MRSIYLGYLLHAHDVLEHVAGRASAALNPSDVAVMDHPGLRAKANPPDDIIHVLRVAGDDHRGALAAEAFDSVGHGAKIRLVRKIRHRHPV